MMRRLAPASIAAGTVTAWLLASLLAGGCGNADFTSGQGARGGGAGSSSGGTSGGKGGNASGGSGGTSGDSGSGGSGTGGASGGNGASGGSAGSASASCAEYIAAYCEWAGRCTEYVYGGSVEACKKLSDSSCAWSALPGVGWTEATFGACAAGYASAECAPTEAICETPGGTLPNGIECATAAQCESGYCNPTGEGCGICSPDPQHPIGGDCETTSNCKPGLDCVDDTCVARREEGETCGGLQNCTSVRDEGYLYCVEGICTLVGLAGEPCFDTGSNTPLCGIGTACTAKNVCAPQVLAAEGEPCGIFDDQVIVCPNGWCVSDEDDPTVARCMDWAGPGEDCHKVPNFERCATGLACENSLCVWPKPTEIPTDCGG